MMQDINIFEQLFQTTGLWGLFGPLALVAIGYYITKKEKPIGVFFILVYSIMIVQYYDLALGEAFYHWHAFIMVLGVISCMLNMISK